MDLFAVILVTITAATICGICLFIFVCAFQPRFLRRWHETASRTFQEAESNASFDPNEDRISLKGIELKFEETDETNENSPKSNTRDRNVYLKSLERSLRTGRRIQEENQDDDDNQSNDRTKLHLNPLYWIRLFFNKYVCRRRRSDADVDT